MRIWLSQADQPGQLVDASQARVSVLDHGFTVADGVFETLKVTGGVAFAVSRHLDRLQRSAAGMGLPAADRDRVLDDISAGAQGSGRQFVVMRLLGSDRRLRLRLRF